MDVDFGAIWAADFDNAIRFHVRRPARRLRVTLRQNKNSKDMTDVSLWVSILGLLVADFNNVIRFYVPPEKGHPSAQQNS